jgi:hypothetical protein
VVYSNKHVIVALIVAPILSVIAWLAVDAYVGEQPQSAQAGQSYPLVAESNCRYASGRCTMSNEDFSLSITFTEQIFTVSSDHLLEAAYLDVADPSDQPSPKPMVMAQDNLWRLQGVEVPGDQDRLYVVVQTSGVRFFGDAATQSLLVD